MTAQAIFVLQFILSVMLFSLVTRWVVAPWLAQQSQRVALFWLTLPHAFHYIGMVFLVPGAAHWNTLLSLMKPLQTCGNRSSHARQECPLLTGSRRPGVRLLSGCFNTGFCYVFI